jgi:hypothetical protein
VLIAGATATGAQEQLIMPYHCSMGGGRIVLTPAREQSYRIYANHERRRFTACSPIYPKLCRSWLLHRFDLDCAGARVSWLSVVGAASEQRNGRAWVENGRLRVRMGPWWAIGPGPERSRVARRSLAPCAAARWRGPMIDCTDAGLDRGPIRAPVVVDMPPGFAPALGLAGVFVGQDTPHTDAATLSARADPPRAVLKLPRGEPPRDVPTKGPATQTLPMARPLAAPTQAPVAAQAPPATLARPAAPTLPPAALSPAATNAAQDLNPAAAAPAADSAAASPSIVTQQTRAHASRPTETLGAPTPAVQTPVHETIPAAPEAERQQQTVTAAAQRSASPSSLSVVPSLSTGQAALGFAGVITVMLSLFVWTRARESRRMAVAGTREVAAVGLDDGSPTAQGHTMAATPHTLRLNPGPPPATNPAPARTPQTPAPAPLLMPLPGDRLPRNREEACRIIGASPDASEAVIKKIVDALRQSWHPDHAGGLADRDVREQRMKQINVAWDIISGKRAQP